MPADPPPISETDLARALDALPDPARGGGLVASGRVAVPRLGADGIASVIVDATDLTAEARQALEGAIEAVLAPLPGIAGVRVAMTAERRAKPTTIAIASGKGGVGKSTLAANIAVALARAGFRVGLVDADIYGPSQPRLMGAEGLRPTAKDQVLNPLPTGWGVAMLSIGQLVEPGRAVAWRGPMAAGALGQLMDADWAGADILVVDLPPGTGDVQLSMIQKHRPDGAVIVSTPQDLALIDAARAIDLFEQSNVPVLGLVENMAGYRCPHCGELSDPFGNGGAESDAAKRGLPFLGRVPLAAPIRALSDAGTPPAASDGPEGEPFHAIAARIAAAMNLRPA